MIRFEALTKVFSAKLGPAIGGVSFDVWDGEIVGFVGLNGAGKTTTIRLATGASLPTSGRALIDGHDVVAEKIEASKRLGWVPETPNFEPNSKALALLKYFAGFHGISGGDAESRSLTLLKSVGLEGSESKKIRAYSQGMKKRFALAASMLGDPHNFLFDEVLNGLDPEGIRYFHRLMLDLKGEGKAVLLSSHILVEVESIADRIVFIHRGRIIKTIVKEDLATVGGSVIKVAVNNLDDRALSYLKGLGETRIEGNKVFISTKDADPAEVNASLVRMGYRVSELAREKQGLEAYFLQLIAKAS